MLQRAQSVLISVPGTDWPRDVRTQNVLAQGEPAGCPGKHLVQRWPSLQHYIDRVRPLLDRFGNVFARCKGRGFCPSCGGPIRVADGKKVDAQSWWLYRPQSSSFIRLTEDPER
jgi:hypothetical protein